MFVTIGFGVLLLLSLHLLSHGHFCNLVQVQGKTDDPADLTDQCRKLSFSCDETTKVQRLENHGIYVRNVDNEDLCQILCYMEPNCVRYNIQMETGATVSQKCELNNSTYGEHKSDLKLNPTYKYCRAESACANSPCKNNGTCQTGFTDRGYRCLYAAGFDAGRNCEKYKYNDTLPFSRKQVTDYVITRDMPSLTSLTVCLWMRTSDTKNAGTPLSSNLQGNDVDELTLVDYRNFRIVIGEDGTSGRTQVSANDELWHHICVTWENNHGSWNLYKDGQVARYGRGLKKGHVIKSGGALVLGQELDSFESGFSLHQCFIGEMTSVNIWDHLVHQNEIQRMSVSCHLGAGNVFPWTYFRCHMRGSLKMNSLTTCYN